MDDKAYKKAASRSISAGKIPFPLSDTLVELFKILVTGEEARFLAIFRKPSMNLDQVKEKRPDMDEQAIKAMLDTLMDKGVIMGSTSSSGIEVFTLMPPFPGLVEFTLMKGGTGEKEKRLAVLFERMFEELSEGTQTNYENFVPQLRGYPAPARVVPAEDQVVDPVEQHAEIAIDQVVEPKDIVLLPQQVSAIIDKEDSIAVTHCYCRHQKELSGSPCKRTAERENCLLFGKVATHSIKHGFAKPITKGQAKALANRAEKDGLVHKIFHAKMDVGKHVEGICSCCPCCCGIFQLYFRGALPMHTHTYYLPAVDAAACTGCGTCTERCPMEAIELVEDVASIQADRCIGCGACAETCPADAIAMNRSGPRDVFVPPRRVRPVA